MRTYLKLFLAIAAVAGFSGCAGTQVQNKETLLSEAGFRMRVPSTPAQLAIYNSMTPYKLERSVRKGKVIYTYADTKKRLVYIGGETAYQRYRQLATQQSIAEKEMEAAYNNELADIDKAWSLNLY